MFSLFYLGFCFWPLLLLLFSALVASGVAGTPLSAMCDLLRRALSFERYDHLMRHKKGEGRGGGRSGMWGLSNGKASHTLFHLLRLIAVDVRRPIGGNEIRKMGTGTGRRIENEN